MQDVSPAQVIVTILIQLAGLTISIIGMTFLYVWLYNYTQSVFLAIIFHALTNIVPLFVLSFLADQQVLTFFSGIIPWVIVFALQRTLGKKRFPEQVTSI